METGKDLLKFHTDDHRVTAIASHEQLNFIATGGDEGVITLWRADTGIKIGSIKSGNDEITALRFIESRGQLVAADKGGSLCFYRIGRSIELR